KALTVNVTEPSTPDPETHRIAGSNRYETAIGAAETLKSLKGAELFDSIIVADGRNYPDALAGSFLAAKISSSGASPVLLVNPATEAYMVEYIQANLADGGTVYVLGGAGAVSENFTALLEEAGMNCSRLAGPNRYETNLAILEAVGSASSGSFVICSGTSFADSLSASSLGLPLMLAGSSLTDAQLAFLASHAGGTCYIVGGTGAVSEYVESQIRALGLATERVAGKDRMRTSLAVAERFFGSAEKAVLAYAFNYPDGLTGSAVAFQLGAPILLTDSSSTYTARRFVRYRTAVVTDVYVMGGSALISDAALEAICGTR
ncbi:MAG: cell wall-binding repeat-containing protein, partial [Firmicutes bacterium]|nr:cell wall-binding repeat-containing protein [Bacillota bacterium]